MLCQSNGAVTKEPLTQREALIILESLYDTLLEVEQLRREQPPQEEEEHFQEWFVKAFLFSSLSLIRGIVRRSDSYDGLVKQLWDGLNVMVPLETWSVVCFAMPCPILISRRQRSSSIHFSHYTRKRQKASASAHATPGAEATAHDSNPACSLFLPAGRCDHGTAP